MNDIVLSVLVVMFLGLVLVTALAGVGFALYHGFGVYKVHKKMKRRKHLKIVK